MDKFSDDEKLLISYDLIDIKTRVLLNPFTFDEVKIDRRRNDYKQLVRDIADELRQEQFINTPTEFKELKEFKNPLNTVEDFNILFQSVVSLNSNNFHRLLDLVDTGEKLTILVELKNDIKYQFHLNPNNLSNFGLGELLQRGFLTENIESYGSDIYDEIAYIGIRKLTLLKTPKGENSKENKGGGYFDYENTSGLDLSRYQIYDDEYNDDLLDNFVVMTNTNCLLYAFEKLGVSNEKIELVKLSLIGGSHISKTNLKLISGYIGYKIVIYYFDKNFKIRNYSFGESGEELKIALYLNHYFIYEITKYTKFYINNLDLCLSKNYNINIYEIEKNGRCRYSDCNTKKINSLMLVKTLYDNNYFKRSDRVLQLNPKKIYNSIISDIDFTSEYIQRPLICREKKLKDKYIFYADCESDVVSNDNHIPIMIGVNYCDDDDDDVKIFVKYNDEAEMINNFLNYVKNRFISAFEANGKNYKNDFKKSENLVIIYFHNLKYDYLGLIQKYVNNKKSIIKDSAVYSSTINFYGLNIELRDSLKLMPKKLADFTEIFGLDAKYVKKEAMGYCYYTVDNIKKLNLRIKVADYLPYVNRVGMYNKLDNPDEIKNEFIKILESNKKVFEYDGFKFNPVKYYRYYLKYDVLVLKHGMQKYEKIINDITSNNGKIPLDLNNYLTISSLTHNYMLNNGAYDGLYEVGLGLKNFIGQAVQGGRVNVCDKFKKTVINEKIEDFDGVSLYPSAIKRICDECGYPMGEIKPIIDFTPNNYDYYIIKIKLLKINKKQQNPFIGVKNKNGIIDYINEVVEPIEIVVDKLTLEDYITYHNIEYEFVEGIYWNEGYNNTMGELILDLFNTRLKYKKLMKECKNDSLKNGYNSLQEVVKLMMNSSYGKTMIKSSNTTIKYVNKDKYDKKTKKYSTTGDNGKNYLYNNFNWILYSRDINQKQLEIKQYSVDKSYNLAYVGCNILSMSKRIMNEVMDVANTNKLDIYYQDTDSMHIKSCDIKTLQEKFNKKFGRELIGKNLGQFHSDFNLKNSVGQIYSTKSIFLGKKCYIDYLESRNKNGDIINGFHYRMKGVNEGSIKYLSLNEYGGNIFKVYEELASGKELEFILNPTELSVSFEYVLGGIKTRSIGSFTRNLKF